MAVERSAQEILAALYTYDDNDPTAWKRRASEVMAVEGRGQVLEELFLRRVLRPALGSEIGNVQLLDLRLTRQMDGNGKGDHRDATGSDRSAAGCVDLVGSCHVPRVTTRDENGRRAP